MRIEPKYNDKRDYGDARNTDDIEYIVVQSIDNKALTHYHVIGNKVYQMIPDKYMSDSVNGFRLSFLGKYHGICTKYNSLSIGIIDDGELMIHLIITLMQRYKISPDKVLRKQDITGEANPELFFDNDKWDRVKRKLVF